MKMIFRKYVDKLLTLACGLCVLIIMGILLQITTFASFRVPTGSMSPTILSNDYILVNKSIMGARIFDIWEAAEEREVEIHRLPGLGKVKRNDVLGFTIPIPIRTTASPCTC